MDPAIGQLLTSLGLSKYLELAGVIVMICSALDAAIPQPAEGSHWLPLRKALSFLALNLRNASPSGQPSIATWLLRIVKAVMAAGMLKGVVEQANASQNPVVNPDDPTPVIPAVPATPPADPAPVAPPVA